jgi:hypothetical protein
MKKKEIRVIVPEKLYNDFKKECKSEYKTISEVIRSNMLKYIKEK